ncbi:MAG: ADP-ribosylglycohydrolase family protein [Ignavibacteriaceae bacterium]|jgi:ADP-ribosylglycohydrolase|nr:ADP-ribosylglycohydrolase family protein [Ignavibacteriaceae bacterium]
MLGAVIGDIVGSRFEFANHRSKEFELLHSSCFVTDDSILTFATYDAIANNLLFSEAYKKWTRLYPDKGYGGNFRFWAFSDNMKPYNSYGNGSAMRVSPCGWASDDLPTVLSLAEKSAAATHNHPEGIKGALATAHAVFLARMKHSKQDIKKNIELTYNYSLDFDFDELVRNYRFDVSCQGTVPQALFTFLISDSFEDSLRNAVCIGGDSDTLAAVNGAVAEAFYGIPRDIQNKALVFLDSTLLALLSQFQKQYIR